MSRGCLLPYLATLTLGERDMMKFLPIAKKNASADISRLNHNEVPEVPAFAFFLPSALGENRRQRKASIARILRRLPCPLAYSVFLIRFIVHRSTFPVYFLNSISKKDHSTKKARRSWLREGRSTKLLFYVPVIGVYGDRPYSKIP